MPKKQRNAFYFYMLHYKQYEESQGRRFSGGMREVADAAGPYWKRLNAQEKEPYERKAKEDKNSATGRPHERYTSSGVPLSQIEQMEKETQNKISNQRKKVEEIINYGVEEKCLKTQNFCILTFNYFIKDVHNQYYPAEMGIVKFNMENGVTEKSHLMINPGKLPTGFAYSAMSHADETHKLPVYPKALGSTDYEEVLHDLTAFVCADKSMPDSDNFYILVLEDEEKMIENIIAQLCEKAQIDPEMYKLLPLTYFFYKIRTAIEKLYNFKQEAPFTDITAQIYLDRDVYRYNKGNGCDYHETKDVNYHCAVSRTTRWAYTILDQLLEIADVETREPGYHYPVDYKRVFRKREVKNEDEYDDYKSTTSKTASSMRGRIKDEFSDTASTYSRRTDDDWEEGGSEAKSRRLKNPFAMFRSTLEENDDKNRPSHKPNFYAERERQARMQRPFDESYKEKLFQSKVRLRPY